MKRDLPPQVSLADFFTAERHLIHKRGRGRWRRWARRHRQLSIAACSASTPVVLKSVTIKLALASTQKDDGFASGSRPADLLLPLQDIPMTLGDVRGGASGSSRARCRLTRAPFA